MLDTRIDIGIIITVLGFIGGFSAFALKLFYEIGKINQRLDLMWDWFMQNHQGPSANGMAPPSPREAPRTYA